jgi:hypothetical protein
MENLKQKYDKMCDEHLAQCPRCNDNIDAMTLAMATGAVTESQLRKGLADYREKNPGNTKFDCPDFPDFPEE